MKCSHKIRPTTSNALVIGHQLQMLLSKGKCFAAFCRDRSIGLASLLLWFFLFTFGQPSRLRE